MDSKKFILNKYPHLEGSELKNPIIDFELNDLCLWFTEYATLCQSEREKELMKQFQEIKKAARDVVKEATGVYCHYNNLYYPKISVGFENLKELNFLISKTESK